MAAQIDCNTPEGPAQLSDLRFPKRVRPAEPVHKQHGRSTAEIFVIQFEVVIDFDRRH